MYNLTDFQHPRDNQFASEIMNSAVTKNILDNLHKTNLESLYIYLYKSSCPQLTEKTAPELFNLLVKACNMFGLKKIPQVFVTRNYDERVSALGVNEPFLVFSSEYLRKLNGDMLFGVLAGQVAAILCQHHTILYLTWGIDFASGLIPGGSLVVAPMINNWKRCRYFTYDRAFCLATKNRALALRQVLVNVLPADILDNMKIGLPQDNFIAQVDKFMNNVAADTAQVGFRKVITMFSEKDWLPERYSEINKFCDERRI